MATPVVPLAVRHFDDTGRYLYLELLERELADGRRIVHERAHAVAFQPFAVSAPFGT